MTSRSFGPPRPAGETAAAPGGGGWGITAPAGTALPDRRRSVRGRSPRRSHPRSLQLVRPRQPGRATTRLPPAVRDRAPVSGLASTRSRARPVRGALVVAWPEAWFPETSRRNTESDHLQSLSAFATKALSVAWFGRGNSSPRTCDDTPGSRRARIRQRGWGSDDPRGRVRFTPRDPGRVRCGETGPTFRTVKTCDPCRRVFQG
jgi:hypothetical protein